MPTTEKCVDVNELMEHGERDLIEQLQLENFETALRRVTELVHRRNKRWWLNPATNEPIERNVGEMLMLCVSELAEGMEGHRKKLQDDKLPHRPMLEVELADCMIRLMDVASGLGLDLAGAFIEKMEFNRTRIDHTNAARLAPGGKTY